MRDQDIQDTATRIAQAHELPPLIVRAVITVESDDQPYAIRFEPAYRWCWNMRDAKPYTASPSSARRSTAPGDFPTPNPAKIGVYSSATTEWIGQKTSWGLMQIMGAVAREHGYTGPLPQLTDIDLGIEYGCRHLARLRDRFIARHGWAGVLDAYNDGTPRIERDPDYPDRVAAVSPAVHALIYPDGDRT